MFAAGEIDGMRMKKLFSNIIDLRSGIKARLWF